MSRLPAILTATALSMACFAQDIDVTMLDRKTSINSSQAV